MAWYFNGMGYGKILFKLCSHADFRPLDKGQSNVGVFFL